MTLCLLKKFEGRLQSLNDGKDDAFNWLESTATTALVKREMNRDCRKKQRICTRNEPLMDRVNRSTEE